MISSTNTCGGGIDQTAVIGHAPEHRDWKHGDRSYYPCFGQSVRIEAFVTVDAGMGRPTTIGAGTWLLKHSHIGHDAVIGRDCEVACGAKIGGHAEIGDRVKIGLNAVVLPYVKIGDGARLGALSVATRDIPPGEIWAGVPARRLDRSGFDTNGATVAKLNAA